LPAAPCERDNKYEKMTSYGRIAAVALMPLIGLLVLTVGGHHVSSTNHDMEGTAISAYAPCPTMPDCVASPSCSQHCSSLTNKESSAPLAPAVTSDRSQIEPVIVQAVAADVHKPPPRLV
jgi:hypothetical protein